MLRIFLRYKCDGAGVADANVNDALSTRTCSERGSLSGQKAQKRSFAIMRWARGDCIADHDRAPNAALNI